MDLNSQSFPQPRFNLTEVLDRISHWLPAQGPVKDFVHHNTLHAFQHLKFEDAIRSSARLYGAKVAMPGSFYFQAYKSGAIAESALDRALETSIKDSEERRKVKSAMLASPIEAPHFKGLAETGFRSHWHKKLGVSLDRLVNAVLCRLIGGYLDQGLSLWRMPGADQLGFFDAVASMVQKSWLPLRPLNSAIAKELLSLSATEATYQALKRIVGREDYFESYILEMLLAQPGWAGLVNQCEQNSTSLLSSRTIRLIDYVAINLLIEVACLEEKLTPEFQPLHSELPHVAAKPDAIPAWTREERLLFIWQQAFEWSYYEQLLGGIFSVAPQKPKAPNSSAWAFFCIDDRECSLRRHIEEVSPQIRTYATAGFFGLDFMYQGAADTVAGKHCPVPIKPKFLVVEESDLETKSLDHPSWRRKTFSLEPQSNTFFRGWILSHALGFGAALRLAASVFRPSLAPVSVPPLSTVSHSAKLKLYRHEDKKTKEGLWIGFSVPELAERVKRLLDSVGLEGEWPEIVVFFGHGSSSVNNPYFAAYNCGACSGRPGAPNARAFAEAANMPEVRRHLRAEGLTIPDTTCFIGALHDTSLDEVTYFDTARIPHRFFPAFQRFQKAIKTALERNAAERCRRFDSVRKGIPPKDAISEVQTRAVSLFEPRPEYNHATNASCIIGRRSLTEGLFLDRRSFLSSYDPLKDLNGETLAQILAAVVPVCGGINLEYYFSRIDAWKYGAGTKLSQNVAGLIGLINGIEGDLLTGLPTQMTEIHDPIRLLIVVEQTPDIALEAARQNPTIFEWIENEWVHYTCVDPSTHDVWIFKDDRMEKVSGLCAPIVCWKNSLEAAYTSRENLPMGFVKASEVRS